MPKYMVSLPYEKKIGIEGRLSIKLCYLFNKTSLTEIHILEKRGRRISLQSWFLRD